MALEKLNVIGNEYKCIVDLEKYNKESKGRILYNHIFYHSLPDNYIQAIVRNKFYFKIIDHKNYSPRIIEYIVKDNFWQNTSPEQYLKKVIDTFDNPSLLWGHVYENQISELSRCILAILTTIGVPITLHELDKCVEIFLDKYSYYYCSYSESEFKKSIKELENTFIFNNMINENRIITEFQNPSIRDFLCYFYSNNTKIIERIIDSSLYVNQLFEVFTENKSQSTLIQINSNVSERRESRLLMDYDNLLYLSIVPTGNKRTEYYYTSSKSEISKLYYVLNKLSNERIKPLGEKLSNVLLNIDIDKLNYTAIEKYMGSVGILKEYCFAKLVDNNTFNRIFENINAVDELLYFRRLKNIDYEIFENCITSETSKKRIADICWDSKNDYSNDNLEEFRDYLEDIELSYNVGLEDTIQSVEEQISEYKDKIEHYEPDYDLMRKEEMENNYIHDSIIDEMFNSLLESNEKK